jgi:hypothetical protein
VEVREAIGDKFPKHIYSLSTAAGGADGDRWTDWPAAIAAASTAQLRIEAKVSRAA